jgi:Flp pilus assembly protein TadG
MIWQLTRSFGICGLARARALSSCVDQFLREREGSVAIIFAVLLIPVTVAIGMSVDLGQAVRAKTQLQVTLDAAALAAGRAYQTTSDAGVAEVKALEHFAAVLPDNVAAEITRANVNEDNAMIEIAATATVNTTFLTLLGMDEIKIALSSSAATSHGQARKNLEIAMMLDITGSMSGQKIADLKLAAKDLVQSLLPTEEAAKHARIAIVPFSETVRPGSDVLARAIGAPPASKSVRDVSGRRRTYWLTACVSERVGVDAFTDAAPAAGSYAGPAYTSDGSCLPGSEILPLTSDKSMLDARIDDLSATGWTAGQIGTAWAWYVLAPSWSDVWPLGSEPAASSDDVMKVAVLMTDGEYNTDYRQGIQTRTIGGAPDNGSSDSQARQLCAPMKAAGVTVYTVGFQLTDSNAIETMTGCASGESYAFLADDGSQLRQAFRDIAFRLSDLRLTR